MADKLLRAFSRHSRFPFSFIIAPLTINAENVGAPIFESNVIPALIKMLQAEGNDDGVRTAAAGLLQTFALHSGFLVGLVLPLLTTTAGNVRSEVLESDVIPPLVQMLEHGDECLWEIAASLLQEFALHGGSPFSSILLLLTIILENVAPAFLESNVIPPIVKMLWGSDKHGSSLKRTVAADLLQKFAQHSGSLLSSVLLLLTVILGSGRISILETDAIPQIVQMLENNDIGGVSSIAVNLLQTFALTHGGSLLKSHPAVVDRHYRGFSQCNPRIRRDSSTP